jgi:hypothetical protein
MTFFAHISLTPEMSGLKFYKFLRTFYPPPCVYVVEIKCGQLIECVLPTGVLVRKRGVRYGCQ